MLILLSLTQALACSPPFSDTIEILPADGTVDAPKDVRFFVRLGDAQVQDPELGVVIRDASGDEIDVTLHETWSHADLEGFRDWRLTPTGLLEPGEYTVTVSNPGNREQPTIATIQVGDLMADSPARPTVEIVSMQDIEEIDPCFGPRRVVTATLDPGETDDLASVAEMYVDLEPDGFVENAPDRVLMSPGGRITLRFNAELPDDRDAPTCVRAIVEGSNGERSEASEPDCGTPATDPDPDAVSGCNCSTVDPAGAWWLALPLLALFRRR